jgi:hypothetical protein
VIAFNAGGLVAGAQGAAAAASPLGAGAGAGLMAAAAAGNPREAVAQGLLAGVMGAASSIFPPVGLAFEAIRALARFSSGAYGAIQQFLRYGADPDALAFITHYLTRTQGDPGPALKDALGRAGLVNPLARIDFRGLSPQEQLQALRDARAARNVPRAVMLDRLATFDASLRRWQGRF